ncbi:50S ribosomal protein L4 [Candidatus Saccharibacteria bacterium CG_4_10_14_0_2_um_filter_52_9]|nr:MAG: 50S ribosomal protein L4 [Candidatus Saccharibacteria bacterium CG_4_10_14_0_2_um_filter_52_9]
MAVATYTKTGTKATAAAKLDKAVFGVETKNHELLKVAYNAYLANSRENLAVVKTRGLVRGGGKKPWTQKGTGRARFGSSRVPIWRGGGITFGPTGNENYSKQLNTKAKRLAIRQALSLASTANKITVIEDIVSKAGKTADLAKLLAKIDAERKVLLVVEQKAPELVRAANNLPGVQVVGAKYVNVYDVLNSDCIVFSQTALKATTDRLGKEAK